MDAQHRRHPGTNTRTGQVILGEVKDLFLPGKSGRGDSSRSLRVTSSRGFGIVSGHRIAGGVLFALALFCASVCFAQAPWIEELVADEAGFDGAVTVANAAVEGDDEDVGYVTVNVPYLDVHGKPKMGQAGSSSRRMCWTRPANSRPCARFTMSRR